MRFNLITDLSGERCDLADRGLQYGDGLFETMLLSSGQIHYWTDHYVRLRKSAQRLGIDCPERDWLEQALAPYLALESPHIIKLMLTRGCGGRGIELPSGLTPNVYLLHYPYKYKNDNQLVKATISEVTLSCNRSLAGIKHLNRLPYVLAARQLRDLTDYNEALLCDDQGNVIESIVNNLFFVTDGEVCTPDISDCGVSGILRQRILKLLKQRNKHVTIAPFKKADLLVASECLLCNSVQGIRPIVRLEQQAFPIGPLTQQLQQEFYDLTDV